MNSHDLGVIYADCIDDMTAIVAALVREGVTFSVRKGNLGVWHITLTGGY